MSSTWLEDLSALHDSAQDVALHFRHLLYTDLWEKRDGAEGACAGCYDALAGLMTALEAFAR